MTRHIRMDYNCKNCGFRFLPINIWRMCTSCGEDANTSFNLAEAVYDAGVYHRTTHYGRGSHMPSAWGTFSYGDHAAMWGFRLFDWLYLRMKMKRAVNLEDYVERLSLPDGREGNYYLALIQSFYDVFIKYETPLE